MEGNRNGNCSILKRLLQDSMTPPLPELKKALPFENGANLLT